MTKISIKLHWHSQWRLTGIQLAFSPTSYSLHFNYLPHFFCDIRTQMSFWKPRSKLVGRVFAILHLRPVIDNEEPSHSSEPTDASWSHWTWSFGPPSPSVKATTDFDDWFDVYLLPILESHNRTALVAFRTASRHPIILFTRRTTVTIKGTKVVVVIKWSPFIKDSVSPFSHARDVTVNGGRLHAVGGNFVQGVGR